MRFAILFLFLAAACSKKSEPTLTQQAQSKARDLLEQAMKLSQEMDGVSKRFTSLLPRAKDDPAVKKEVDELMQKGQKLAQQYQKALTDAQTAAELVLKSLPDDADALDCAATVAYRTGDFDACAAHLDKLSAAHPDDARISARRATVLRAKGRYAEARAHLKPVLEKHPDEPTALAEDGANAFSLNDFDTALQRLEAAGRNRAAITGPTAFDYETMLTETRETAATWKRETELRAAEAKADDLPRIKLETARGDIVIELFENEAPNTVANFVELVDKQFYDGTRFHRVVPNFIIQGGDPISRDPDAKDVGRGSPGYQIADEMPAGKYRHHYRGSLSMANSGPDTNGSQFFLTHRPTGHLDGRHTVFGRVIEGLEVVDKLQGKDLLTRATVLRKRDHAYRPTLKD